MSQGPTALEQCLVLPKSVALEGPAGEERSGSHGMAAAGRVREDEGTGCAEADLRREAVGFPCVFKGLLRDLGWSGWGTQGSGSALCHINE